MNCIASRRSCGSAPCTHTKHRTMRWVTDATVSRRRPQPDDKEIHSGVTSRCTHSKSVHYRSRRLSPESVPADNQLWGCQPNLQKLSHERRWRDSTLSGCTSSAGNTRGKKASSLIAVTLLTRLHEKCSKKSTYYQQIETSPRDAPYPCADLQKAEETQAGKLELQRAAHPFQSRPSLLKPPSKGIGGEDVRVE